MASHLVFLLLALFFGVPLRTRGASVDIWIPGDTWQGTYQCGAGTGRMTMKLLISSFNPTSNLVSAIFYFSNSQVAGNYNMTGTYNAGSASLTLKNIGKWNVHPSNYEFVDLQGTMSNDQNTYSGEVLETASNEVACSTFSASRTRNNNVANCGMTLNTAGTYTMLNNFATTTTTPCISITASKVILNGNGFRMDASTACTNCVGVQVSATNCTVSRILVNNFPSGIVTNSTGTQITGVTVQTNTTLTGSVVGISLQSSQNTIQGSTILNLASKANCYGIYSTGSNTMNNITIRNITSTGAGYNVSGIYIPSGTSTIITIASISQVKGVSTAKGIMVDSCLNCAISSATITGVTASAATASSVGLYLNSFPQGTVETASIGTVSANGTNAIATGIIISGQPPAATSSFVNGITGYYAYGIQLLADAVSITNVSVLSVQGITSSYGIYVDALATTINKCSVQNVGGNTSYGIDVAIGSNNFTLLNSNITKVTGTTNYGLYLDEVFYPLIGNNSIIQTSDNAYFSSSLTPECDIDTLKTVPRICYPPSSWQFCCSSCRQALSAADCNQCANISACPRGYICVPGQFEDYSCNDTDECLEYEICGPGYYCVNYPGTYGCFDIDECAESPPPCGAGYDCINTNGSFICQDIDECDNSSVCSIGYNCTNTPGSYECNDIDECINVTICAQGYYCANTPGSYDCLDIDECENSTICSPGYNCTNTEGSYICQDVNECIELPPPCEKGFNCNNTNGSFLCLDINECFNPLICPNGYDCVNTNGSYYCSEIPTCPRTSQGICSGIDNGDCVAPICWCKGTWNGPICNKVDIPVQYEVLSTPCVLINDGEFKVCVKEVYEFDTNRATVLSFPLAGLTFIQTSINSTLYNLTTTLNTSFPNSTLLPHLNSSTFTPPTITVIIQVFYAVTNLTFANTSVRALPNSAKMSVFTRGWRFADKLNSFGVVFEAFSLQPANGSVGLQNGSVVWSDLDAGAKSLFVSFIPIGVADGEQVQLQTNQAGNGTLLTVISPSFSQQLVIDPNFAVLVDPNSEVEANSEHDDQQIPMWIIIVVVVCVVAVVVIIAIVVAFKKHRVESVHKKTMKVRMEAYSSTNSTASLVSTNSQLSLKDGK